MALDKWQTRQVAQHAQENSISEDEALLALFPEEAPAPARKVTVKKESVPPAA